MATHQDSGPQGPLQDVSEGLCTIPATPTIPEKVEDPSASDAGPEITTEAVKPHDASIDTAKDEKNDQPVHTLPDRIVPDIAHPDTYTLHRERTVRDAGEPPFQEKMAQRSVQEDLLLKWKEDVAGILHSDELYDVYVRKLQKLRETGDALNSISDQGKPKMLVRSLIDYLSSYEARMKSVEDKLGIASKPEKTAKGNVGPDVPGPIFYDADKPIHPKMDSSNETEDEWNVQGAFCSTVDPNHRIRALFKWKNKPHDDVADTQIPPDPKSVEILEIRVRSKPVAEFFQKVLDHDISNDGLIHIVKPFRCLIRKVDLIRQHVNRVGEQLRSLPKTSSLPDMAEDSIVDSSPEMNSKASTTTGINESSPDSLDSEVAFTQLKELLDFIDSYLQADVDLFHQYKNGTRPNITFNNLWMLFDSTDTIFCPLKKGENKIYAEEQQDLFFWTMEFEIPQVYRVLATLGGIARRPPQEKLKKLSRKFAKETDESASQHIREKWTSLYVDCYFIQFDGVRFRAVADSFELKPFQGELPVTSLEAFPLHYHTSSSNGDIESLLQRGARYSDLTSVQHVNHKGLTLGERKEEINSPVIVDLKSAYQFDSQWEPELKSLHIIYWPFVHNSILEIQKRTCSHADCHKIACLEDASLTQQRAALSKGFRDINILLDDYKVETKEQIEKFKEDMKSQDLLHLLPGAAYAFALRNRKWVKIDLQNIGTVKQEDNWNDLVLPPGHKEMVQAMVESFTRTGSAIANTGDQDDYDVDLVPGKGKGCIILLHGEVSCIGLAKATRVEAGRYIQRMLIADSPEWAKHQQQVSECVAAYTKRPLYPITCGDIGITPSEVELALDSHFSRAHKWGCVLLLDEADIFLAKRNKAGDDIKRNGLVSVFLRTLEYYSGILFLTTNRVGSFDDAFRSRIHVQLHYPKLTQKQVVKIWKTNISRLQRHNEDRKNKNMLEVAIDRKKIVSFAKKNVETLHWNGRQIRNAFQTAVALAEFESRKGGGKTPEVTKKHFQRVAAATSEFDEYLKELNQGFDEEKIARRDQNRVEYTPKTGKFRSVATIHDSSSSDSESSTSSDEDSSGDDSSSSDSDAKRESSDKRKKKRKEGEKKIKKSRKTKDSDKATEKK